MLRQYFQSCLRFALNETIQTPNEFHQPCVWLTEGVFFSMSHPLTALQFTPGAATFNVRILGSRWLLTGFSSGHQLMAPQWCTGVTWVQ